MAAHGAPGFRFNRKNVPAQAQPTTAQAVTTLPPSLVNGPTPSGVPPGGGAPVDFLDPFGTPPPADPADGSTQGFGANNNLVSTQINPTTTPQQQQFTDMLAQLANQVGGFQFSPFQPVPEGQRPGGVTAGSQPRFIGQGPQAERVGAGTAADTVNAGSFGTAADTDAARRAVGDRLQDLSTAPDRGELAGDIFNTIEERGRPQFQRELRNVGDRAASLGRIGAGMTTNELTDVLTTRQRDLDLTRRGLASEAAGETLNDRLNIFGATQGAADQFFVQDTSISNTQRALRNEARSERDFGFNSARSLRDETRGERGFQFGAERSLRDEDRGERGFQFGAGQQLRGETRGERADQFGFGSALRNEARGERSARFAQEMGRFGAESNALGQIGGLQNQAFNQGVINRDETRGERAFQTGEDQRGIDNKLRQRLSEEDLQNSEFNRNQRMRELLANIGFGNGQVNDNVIAQLAALLGGQGENATGSAADLFAEFARRRAGGKAGGTPGGNGPGTTGATTPLPQTGSTGDD